MMKPIESTPAANTRQSAASRGRSGSVSSVGSMDKTHIHRLTQQQPVQLGARDASTNYVFRFFYTPARYSRVEFSIC